MKTVYGDMVGDMFHRGHVKLLKRMTELGDKVIVGVIGDETCKTYKRTPICNLDERVEVISSCKYVDKIIPDAPLIVTEEFMDKYDIDLVVHAHDEDDHFQDEFFKIPIQLGKFKRLDYTKSISTSQLIDRCKNK